MKGGPMTIHMKKGEIKPPTFTLHENVPMHLFTTFLKEFGQYQYLRAPMGLCLSGDEFCQRTDEALGNINIVKKLVDDILIFAPDDETLLKGSRQFLPSVWNRE